MKKINLVLVAVCLVAFTTRVQAGHGIFDSFVILSTSNTGINQFFDLDSVTGNLDFSGFNFGSFDTGAGDFFTVNGGQLKSFEDNGDEVTGARIHWRVYEQGTAPGGFTFNTLSNPGGKTGNDRVWESQLNTFNELDLFNTPGKTYNVDVFGEIFVNVVGNGVVSDFTQAKTASFSIVPAPTAFVLSGIGLAGAALLLRRKI